MGPPGEWVLIANPGSRRVTLFQNALLSLDLPPARLVSWEDLLENRIVLPQAVPPGSVVRIDSPGKDFAVERLLLAIGADLPDSEEYDRISRSSALSLEFDRGRILFPRQWYRGFCEALRVIKRQFAECPPHTLINSPADIAAMFDKGPCQQRLRIAGVPTPRPLPPVRCFEDLEAHMRSAGCSRVFLKLAHGSSASGAVAYTVSSTRRQATSTVEIVGTGPDLRLYNSRRLRTYRDPHEIASLINTLCRHRVHVEEWIPKAGLDGCTFDLRVVTIAGRACHTVVRLSRSPLTNLHLLNARGDLTSLQERLGPGGWQQVVSTAEATATCFPDSLHTGVDLLITPGYRKTAVLEVNAFGDLLPGILWNGMDTYAAQIRALEPPCTLNQCQLTGRESQHPLHHAGYASL